MGNNRKSKQMSEPKSSDRYTGKHTEKIVVPATLPSTGIIRNFVKEAVALAGIDNKKGYRLQLAVDEIATNIVTHGYLGNGLEGSIEVIRDLTSESLTIILEDSAPPFDPLSLTPPDNLESPLEDRSIGGYGVFLMIKNVDDFYYEYQNGHNRNTFVMKLDVPVVN